MARSALKPLLLGLLAGAVLLAGCKPERKELVKEKVKAVAHKVAESRPVKAITPKRAVPAKLTPRSAAAVAAPVAAAAATADTGNGMAGYTALYRDAANAPLPEKTKAIQAAIDNEDFDAAQALATTSALQAMVAEGRRMKQEALREEALTAGRDRESAPGAEI